MDCILNADGTSSCRLSPEEWARLRELAAHVRLPMEFTLTEDMRALLAVTPEIEEYIRYAINAVPELLAMLFP